MSTIEPRKIIAIPGSLRQGSSNHTILRYVQTLAPAGMEVTIFEGIGNIPHFNPDMDNDSAPAEVTAFRQLVASAHGVIICTPEYAFGVPGSLKNALDWTASSGSLVDKPVMLVTASTGGRHAHASLLLTLGALSANVLPEATLLVSFIGSKTDRAGAISDEKLAVDLAKTFKIFSATVK